MTPVISCHGLGSKDIFDTDRAEDTKEKTNSQRFTK